MIEKLRGVKINPYLMFGVLLGGMAVLLGASLGIWIYY